MSSNLRGSGFESLSGRLFIYSDISLHKFSLVPYDRDIQTARPLDLFRIVEGSVLRTGSTDGDEVGERGPGDGREAGQEELLEINSDEENEQSSSTNDGTNSADPASERSHTVVSGEDFC